MKKLSIKKFLVLMCMALLFACSKSTVEQKSPAIKLEKASEQEVAFATKLIQCAAEFDELAKRYKKYPVTSFSKEIADLEEMANVHRDGANKYAETKGMEKSKLEQEYSDYLKIIEKNKNLASSEMCSNFYKDNTADVDEIFLLSKFGKLGRLNEQFKYPKSTEFKNEILVKIKDEAVQCMGLYLAFAPELKKNKMAELHSAQNNLFEIYSGVSYYSQLLIDSATNPQLDKYSLESAIRTAYSIRRESQTRSFSYKSGAHDLVNNIENSNSDAVYKKNQACIQLLDDDRVSIINELVKNDNLSPNGYNPK